MSQVTALVSLMFTSSLLTWAPAGASFLCTWTTAVSSGEVHLLFLRSAPWPAPAALRLYHSSWSGPRAPLACAWSDDAEVIRDYLRLCEERAHLFSERPGESLDVGSLFEREDLCVPATPPSGRRPARSVRSPALSPPGEAGRSEVRTHQRVKRGFIVPGTLWCGSGNKAPSYADLGVFAETDGCCREHDQCKHTILSFHSEFGVFNSNIFTMSHCDCDKKFHSCLMKAKDSISDVVGYTFFNLLKMHCFEFSHRLQCTQRNWFGMCKETKMALYAEVYPPTLYESPNPTEVSMNGTSFILNTTEPTELLKSNTSQLFSITAAASTVPTSSTGSPSASISPGTNVTTSTSTVAPTGPESRDDLENTVSTRKQPDTDMTEKQLSCSVYKDLDECRNKILPQQRRHGLHNPEDTTLYHCNCTTRLFQTLAKQRQLTEVQARLLGRVSQSCFLPQDCTAGETCTAALVKLPLLDQRSSADMEEQRHLQAVNLQVRRPNTRRAKRKDRGVRLHKLCLRMIRNKLNKARKQGQDEPAVRQTELA